MILFLILIIFLSGGLLFPYPALAANSSFLYTAAGQRLVKMTEGGDHVYYLPGVEVTVKQDGGISYRRYYPFNGNLVGVRDSAGLSYLHQDQLGSITLATNTTGAIAGELAYFPYGITRGTQGTVKGERKYTGQISDEATTGLYYYNARYYSPILARFTQADTVASGLNRYTYASNNPVINTDPTGHLDGPVTKTGSLHDWDETEENFGTTIETPHYSYIPQTTNKSCGMAVMAMMIADQNNGDVTQIYQDVLAYYTSHAGTSDLYLGFSAIESYMNIAGLNSHYFYHEEPWQLFDLQKRLDQNGSIIIDVPSFYGPATETNIPNHWVIVDQVVTVNNITYVIVRDPLRSAEEFDPLENLRNYMVPLENGSIMIPADIFVPAMGHNIIYLNNQDESADSYKQYIPF